MSLLSNNRETDKKEQDDIYQEKDEYDKAIETIAMYTEAIRLNSKLAFDYRRHGDEYHEEGEYNKAIANYSKAARFDSKLAFDYRHRGDAYCETCEYDNAIADFTDALRLHFSVAMKWYNSHLKASSLSQACDIYQTRAQLYIEKKDFHLAAFDLKRALELCPENIDIKKKLMEAQRALREKLSQEKRAGLV